MSEFHWRMLYEQACEFREVLRSLGAITIDLKVVDSSGSDKVNEKELFERLTGRDGPFNAQVESHQEFFRHEVNNRFSEMSFHEKHNRHNPTYPRGDNFPFFNDNLNWQSLAKDVCAKKTKEIKFRLCYANDFGYTTQFVGDLEVAVSDGIERGAIAVGVETKFSLAVNKSLVWEYTAEF